MKYIKKISFYTVLASLILAYPVWSAVTVTTGPVSLVTSPILVKAPSQPIGLLAFDLTQTAGETLSSVTVNIANSGFSAATGSHFTSVAVYKDNGNGTFDPATDLLAGSQTSVNVGSNTVITTASNNSIDGGRFFVSLATSSSWTSVVPADSVTVTLPVNGIVTSANSPTVTAVATSTLTADTIAPTLSSVVIQNTGGNPIKEAGDSIIFNFSEPTNTPVITAANIVSEFSLNNSHSFLDGAGSLGSTTWTNGGSSLVITLSGNTSLSTVMPGDLVSVIGSIITDTVGNVATGSATITGNFGITTNPFNPLLIAAVAKNTGGTLDKEAGDTIHLIFSRATNKPAITSSNIATTLGLNNGHSFLDGSGILGSTTWNTPGTALTITLSSNTSLPTVVVGDMVTVIGTLIKDTFGNNVTGSALIRGSFGGKVIPGTKCDNGLVNGQLYRVGEDGPISLAIHCQLKLFKGQAADHANGNKFKNITTINNYSGNIINWGLGNKKEQKGNHDNNGRGNGCNGKDD